MEDIKELMKKAKKEEKKNPEFLYQLGLRFKNGEGVDKDEKKAAKYFEKAADLGHVQGQIETAIRWWKYWKSYYYANLYFQKAIDQGSKEAKSILAEMKNEEAEKQANKNKSVNDDLIHCSNKTGQDLFEKPKFKDDTYTIFCKEHTFVCCPACRGKIKMLSNTTEGQLSEKLVWVYNKGTSSERLSDSFDNPTYEGQTSIQEYQCQDCNLVFVKTTHTKYIEKDKEQSFKQVLTDTWAGLEWCRNVTISYHADETKVGKDVLKVLRLGEGKFEDKI